MKNITVLGCGRWGSFLAWYADKLGHQATLWGRSGSQNLAALQQTRRNEYLSLSDDIVLTDDLGAALSDADFVIISINAQSLRSLLKTVSQSGAVTDRQTYILCMKGIESVSGQRLTQVFDQEMPTQEVAVWVGPGHVQSFLAGTPNCMVIDSSDEARTAHIVEALGSDLIRFYYGTDLIGNEIGAATKNIVGIAAGMLDGYQLTALKGALMARAPHEIARLIVAMGGKAQTAYGLGHLGDYEATLFSPYSHNRRFGEDFIHGIHTKKLAEGVPTLKAVHVLGETLPVDLPICQCLHRVLIEGKNPRAELNRLFERPLKNEFI